jgi:hypothetical protein
MGRLSDSEGLPLKSFGSVSISAGDRKRIEEFIQIFLSSPYHRPVQFVLNETEAYFAQRLPSTTVWLPHREMLAGTINTEGVAPWRPIPSPLDEETVIGFERFLRAPLPPLFKAYLTSQCLLCMDLDEGQLPVIDPRNPFSWLEWSFLASKTLPTEARIWLTPFTPSIADLGMLCFDTRVPDQAGDFPIRMVLQNGASEQVFGSFKLYLDFLQDWLAYKSSRCDVFFGTWLRERGKPIPPPYYYDV